MREEIQKLLRRLRDGDKSVEGDLLAMLQSTYDESKYIGWGHETWRAYVGDELLFDSRRAYEPATLVKSLGRQEGEA